MFGLTLAGFTVVHFFYILKNQTSIEYVANCPVSFRVDFDESGQDFEIVTMKPENLNLYDMGPFKNWCTVMGSNPLLWLRKCFILNDNIEFIENI